MSTIQHFSSSECKKNRSAFFSVAICSALIFILGGAHTAFAAVTVTAATGGTNLSADNAANATSPAYTTLGNIVIAENTNSDFAASQTNTTLRLTAPSGWAFNAGVGSVSFTSNRDITAASISVTASTITVTLSTDNNANRSDTLTISGIQVRATDGASLPSSGNILRTAANPGTASINGITNDSTNFGSLSQVAGNATKLSFSTQPGSATYGSNLSPQPVVKSQDQFSNNSATGLGSSKVVTLTLSSGTGSLSGTASLDIGTAAGNGTVSFSGLSVTAAGTGKALTASATGLTSAVSSTFTISALPVALTGTRTYDTTATAAFGILSVSNKVGSDDVVVASGSATLSGANAGVQTISSFGTLALGGTASGNYTLTGGSGTVTITKATPTLSVTNSPVTYNGSPQAATVSGSVPGSVSNIKYDGSATTPTNAGTYAVTADFSPTDTTNYNSVVGASAGNFVISKATPTLSVTNSPVTYSGSPQAAAVSGSVSGSVSNIKYDTSGTTPTNAGTYAVTANFTPTDTTNYNSLTDASAGNFVISMANQTITFDALSDKTTSDSDFTVSATASSGLTVTFSSLTTSVCTVSTATVHLVSTGTCTIRASQAGDGNYNAATNVDRSFAVTPGVLDHFAFAVIGTQTAGTAFNITITAQDVNNNTLTSYTGTVDLTTNAGTIAPTQSGAFTSGVRTESVTLTGAGTLKTITATDHGGTKTGTSNTFTVNAGALDHFSFAAISDQTAGVAFNVTMTAQDANNNTVTGYTGTVDLTTTAGTITPTESGAFSAGVRTESVTVTLAGSNKTITATDHGGTKTGTSGAFTVVGGAIASFSLSNPGDMYARTRLGYTVSRSDSFGNSIGTGTTTVYLYSSSISSTKKFYDDSLAGSIITSIDIVPGSSSSNFWYYDEEPGTYTITVSDATPTADGATGIDDATDSVTVNPVAVKFVILPPSNGTVDAPVTVTIQAQKPDNSVDTNYQNDVTLNTSGSATGGGLVDIINGVGTKDISDTVAETVNLSLGDSQTTGLDVSSTQSIVFSGGVTAQFTLNDPSALTAGQRVAYAVTRRDQYGNTTTQSTNTVYLYSSSTSANKKFYDAATGGSIITSISIAAGQSTADVWYYDDTPGTWSITASDNSSAPDGNTGINDAVDSLSVTAGPVASFTLNDPGDMTAGTRLGYTVTRKDQFSNLVTDGSTSVYLYGNSTGTSSPVFYDAATDGNAVTSISISAAQSSAQFWYYDPNPGTWTVTASDNAVSADGATGVADATDSVTVSAAPIVATRFVILPPTNGTVDAPITVTVQAQNAAGDLDTTYQNDVTLNASGSATGGGLVDIINGVGTKSISDTVAQNVLLSLTDSQSTGLGVSSTQTVTFGPGAAAQFALNNPGDVAAGARIGYTLTRQDQYGNAVTSGATTAYLYSSSTGVNKKFYDAASGGSAITFIVIPNGSSSVGFWSYDEKAGTWTITASDNASAPDGATGMADASDSILVQSATLDKFVLNEPGNMTANTRLGYTVSRKDQFDNLVTTGVTLAYLYSSATATTTKFYSVSSGGAPVTFSTINDGNSSGTFWYYSESPGTWTVTASDNALSPDGSSGVQDAVDSVTVSAMPIVATRFVILQPDTVQVGTAATVTVEARDDSGNVDTTNQSAVTLVASGSATGDGLVTMVNGVGTKQLQNTVAETVTLTLSDTQSTGLNVSSSAELVFSAVPVVPTSRVGAGAAGAAPPTAVAGGVLVSGYAFPRARVQALSITPDGTTVQAQATATASGIFSLLIRNFEIGIGSYGVVASDTLGRTTQTRVLTARSSGSRQALSISGVALSPTLGLVHPIVRQNDLVGFVGQAMPSYNIRVQIDGGAIERTVQAGPDGSYKLLLSTAGLSLGSHTVRVRQEPPTGSGLQSEYSPQKVFIVTLLFTPQTDFNQDGIINVQDWSIFLSRWSSPNRATQLLDDLNGDGKLDVTDLSIFVRTLKR